MFDHLSESVQGEFTAQEFAWFCEDLKADGFELINVERVRHCQPEAV